MKWNEKWANDASPPPYGLWRGRGSPVSAPRVCGNVPLVAVHLGLQFNSVHNPRLEVPIRGTVILRLLYTMMSKQALFWLLAKNEFVFFMKHHIFVYAAKHLYNVFFYCTFIFTMKRGNCCLPFKSKWISNAMSLNGYDLILLW